MYEFAKEDDAQLDEIIEGLEKRSIDIERFSKIPAAGSAIQFLLEGKIDKAEFWAIADKLKLINKL
jgi:hypothetical protein